MNKLSFDEIWGFTVWLGQDWKQKVQKKKKKTWQDLGRAAQGARRNIFNVQYAHPSISAAHRPHSRLSQPSKIKDGGATWHLVLAFFPPPDSPWFLSPRRQPACLHNLLERAACHRPGLMACHGADQPCVAATWRPVWQLTSITVTYLHSSFSRVRHKRDLQVRQ